LSCLAGVVEKSGRPSNRLGVRAPSPPHLPELAMVLASTCRELHRIVNCR